MEKIKGKTCMVEQPSHVKQLSRNHVCKIGLNLKILSLKSKTGLCHKINIFLNP
jgi:hypothetical protein